MLPVICSWQVEATQPTSTPLGDSKNILNMEISKIMATFENMELAQVSELGYLDSL